TAWDYVNRSMPFGDAQSLTADEVYAIVAYILYSNDLIDEDFVLSDENLAAFELPNADGFIVDDRLETEFPKWVREPCMENCKDDVEVTMRAMVLDVTPEEEGGDEAKAPEPAAEEETEVAAADPAEEVAAVDPALIAAGEKVYKKCKACHQVGASAKNRTGPVLNGVLGREAGGVEGFKYSKALTAMAQEGLVWTPEAMAEFLAAPKTFMKGTKMSFRGLRKEEDIAAVTAYLATFEAD
ncbi:MAG: cytochrome c family protein, partial [Pseudomonadota bacterium]